LASSANFFIVDREKEKELSPNTIRTIHRVIRHALEDAVQWKKLVYNPIQHVKLPKARKAEIPLLSKEDIERLLVCAQQTPLYALFRIALLLGVRRGELLGLKWSDIDLEASRLTVERSVSYMKDPEVGKQVFIVGPPKTRTSNRTIYLPRDIVEVLRQHRVKQAEA
jgi:integrase